MTLPNFIIIGAQKCGTTSLYNYAIEHPQILPASQKELHFFNWRSKGEKKKGINWYLAQFPKEANQDGFITGEATPDYIIDPHTPKQMFQLVPNVKLIVMLRNPVDRAISHYHHNKATRKPDPLPFRLAIEKESERLEGEIKKLWADEKYRSVIHRQKSYLLRGVYVDLLKHWMGIFPRENFLVLKSEDFFENTSYVANQVFSFLGLPNYEVSNTKKYNESSYKKMSPELRKNLAEYFRPHNQRLEEFLGMKFNWEMSRSQEQNQAKVLPEKRNLSLSEIKEKLNNYQLRLQQIHSELNSKSMDRSPDISMDVGDDRRAIKSSIKIKKAPWLTQDAIKFLEEFFKQKPDASVLEFGSGGSTIWFSKLTKKLVSIEHSKQWHTRVENQIKKDDRCNQVDFRLLPRPYTRVCEEFADEFFDLILVDGRDRVKCIEASIRVLKKGGILMLDDAQREKYKPGKELLGDWQLTQTVNSSGPKHTYWWQKPESNA